MSAISRSSRHPLLWPPVTKAAAIAVGGALAMTVVLAAVALVAAALSGLPAHRVPTLLTTDDAFPRFCAAAGVFTALFAGYITTRTEASVSIRQALAAGLLTAASHAAVVSVLGSPLPPLATAVYIVLTLPAVCLGCYLGSPVRRRSS